MAHRDGRRVQAPALISAWIRALPSVDAVRPPRCPRCEASSRPVGRRLNLVGHGRRSLVLFGAVELENEPGFIDLVCRRYRCLVCTAVCLVVPRGVVAGRRYLMPAIGVALALWSLRLLPPDEVRRRLSPFLLTGASATGWASLRRWARAYGTGDGTLRERAARFAQALLATSPLSAQTHAIEPRIYAASLHHS